MTAPAKKPFAMIREFHLADWFTLGNAACGTCAIFCGHALSHKCGRHLSLPGMWSCRRRAGVRRSRWTHCALAAEEFGDRPGTQLVGRCHLVRCGTGGYCLWLRHARLVRPRHFDLFCRLRRIATCALQHNRGSRSPAGRRRSLTSKVRRSRLRWCWCSCWRRHLHWARQARICGAASCRSRGFTLHPMTLLFGVSGSLMISRLRVPKL